MQAQSNLLGRLWRTFGILLRLIPGVGKFTAASIRPWLAGVFAVSMVASSVQMLWPGMLGRPAGWFWKPFLVNPQVYLPRMNRNLYAVDQNVGGSTVWVGGEEGFLARSDDGGINWTCFTFEASDGTLDNPHACNPDAAAGAAASAWLNIGPEPTIGRSRTGSGGLPAVYAAEQSSALPPAANPAQPSKNLANQLNAAPQTSGNSILLSETAHEFGSVMIGRFAEFRLVVKGSNASTRATITNLKFASGANGPFSVVGGQSCTLADGNSCAINITFSPAKVGPVSDQLNFAALFPLPAGSPSQAASPSTSYSVHLSGTGSQGSTSSTSTSTPQSSTRATSSTAITHTAGDILYLETDGHVGLLVMVEDGSPRFLASYDGSTWGAPRPSKAWIGPSGRVFGLASADPTSYIKDVPQCPPVRSPGTFERLVDASLSALSPSQTPDCSSPASGPGTHVNAISYDPVLHRGWAVGGVDGTGAVIRIDPEPWPRTATKYKLAPVTRGAANIPAFFPIGIELPAPWFYASLLFCLFLLVAAIFGPRQPEPEGITGTAVSDRPLEPDDIDSVGLRSVADGISRFFRNPKTLAPLVLCINGSWGWGKSSLMNLLADDLEHHFGQGHRALLFNAWHHQSEDQILASLLQLVRIKALEPPWTPRGLLARVLIFIKRWPERWFVTVVFCASTVWTFYLAIEILRQDGGVDVGKVAAFLPALLTTLVTLRQLIAGATGFLANPASLLAAASNSGTGQLEAQTTLRERFAKDFKTVTEVLGNGRLVILIDDLDRCQPEKIREIVEAINFLVTAGECYIVLGMAREVVEYYLGNSFSTSIATMPTELLGLTESAAQKPGAREAAFANLYMQKMIQLQYNLRALSDDQVVSMFENSSTPPPSALPPEIPSSNDQRPRLKFEAETRSVLRWEHTLRKLVRGAQYWFMPIMGTALVIFAGIIELQPSLNSAQKLLAPFIHPTTPKTSLACPACDQQTTGTSGVSTTPRNPIPPVTVPTGAVASTSSTTPSPFDKAEIPSSTPGTGSPPLPFHASTEKLSNSQLDATRFGPGVFQILLLVTVLSVTLWLAGQWWLVAIPEAEAAKDSECFVSALRDWAPVLRTIYKTPRGLKQYLNHVRFLAMLQRAQEMPSTTRGGQPFLRKLALIWVSGRNAVKRDGILENLRQRTKMGFSGEKSIPDSILVALAAVESTPGLYEYVLSLGGEKHGAANVELSAESRFQLNKAVEDAAKNEPERELKLYVAKLKDHQEAFSQLNGREPLRIPSAEKSAKAHRASSGS